MITSAFGRIPELIAAFPEHQVPLEGGGRNSQSDLFALLGIGAETAAMTVEAKVSEPFGPTLAEWTSPLTDGRRVRLAQINGLLGLPSELPGCLRYQLLHRTAAAVLEASRFRASRAIMIVQSYSPQRLWFDDFAAFAQLFGILARHDHLFETRLPSGLPLHLGWITGNPQMLTKPARQERVKPAGEA
ncbi:hypothetical protein KEU06_21790 [Pseudaminobacter sp. 19-2017]|uniref:DUF6946 domain-containing protein n=1 Tax=Pseudaminobacter soli (ex Zhang et al. 2022) TaxID=2831468 RepID=A0A942DZU5_9HYPH|nr:hypothetical protein [Pseudaminobacter soli]MBS3651249.1 hypothetical protein [Pseudaminobacter soli]